MIAERETALDEEEPQGNPNLQDEPAAAPLAVPGRARRIATFIVKGWWGVVFCSSAFPLLPVFVVGWIYRLMGRQVRAEWWKASSNYRKGASFREFAAAHETLHEFAHWPNWFAAQNFREAWRSRRTAAGQGTGGQTTGERSALSRIRAIATLPVASLGRNFKIGAQGLFNTWVLTLPAGALWVFSWHAGWNNSFHKGYEQAAVGPLTGLLGVALFIAAMFYVPLAQARQASTGNWRSFYEFKTVRRVIRSQWPLCFLLTGAFALLALPIKIFTTLPGFLDSINPAILDMNRAQLVEYIRAYYFRVALMGFPVLILIRFLAAKVYARGIVACVRDGSISAGSLGESEYQALELLGLSHAQVPVARSGPAKIFRSGLWNLGRIGAGVAAAAIWFAFVAQIYVTEFLYYKPVIGFMNHPLVHLPWFFYMPGGG